MRQTNLSIFIPHNGCPNRCSFCNQNTISGKEKPPTAQEVRQLLAEQQPVLERNETAAEIAFFGGSFTAIPRGYMEELLETAAYFTENFPKQYNGIRCSTRPDCIDPERLDILKKYGMTAVELGAQSMSDRVLAANFRGHTAKDVENAARSIKEYGFLLGLQMMTGLYLDTPDDCRMTAEKFIEIGCDTVRIYPTVILSGTYLGELFKKGEYRSFDFDETIDLCAELLEKFGAAGIPVIRLGLHASRDIEENMLGGVYHPALREKAESRILLRRMLEFMNDSGAKRFRIYTDRRNFSRIIGQKKENRERLLERGFSFELSEKPGAELEIEPLG